MGMKMRLFGSPTVIADDGPHELRPGKTTALVCYVAYEGGWVQREKLLPLLWPEVDETTARNNLRQMLYAIRSEPYAQGLEIEPYRLRWLGQTDVETFHAAEGKGDAKVVSAYGGPLLAGFHVSDATAFMDWLEFEREDLHHTFRRSALRLAQDASADPNIVLKALDDVIDADPFDEDVVRASLQVRQRVHGAAEALRVFHRFASHLEEELGVEPDRATHALVAQIRTSRSPPSTMREAREAPRIVSLPKPLTRFVGRADELDQLGRALLDPGTRLVTIRAPGGMGKTRLAIEAASRVADGFEGPVVFVPLAEQQHPEDIVREAALALGIAEQTTGSPASAVAEALGERDALLVLDNLEQIPNAGRPVADLLASSPGLTVLATSRTVLGIRGEHAFDIRGLPVSPELRADGDRDQATGDAIDVFLNAAARVVSRDELDDVPLEGVARVCRITGGMPLALELAANWTRVFSVEEIAEQLEGGLDLLEDPHSGPTAKHASVRTVIAHSWTDLDAEQRQAMMALSVLRGPFTRAEAFEVAGVGHRSLVELVDRSFLDVLGAGRFGRHPMIDAFVRERASEHDELLVPARNRHVSYFAEHLARLSEGVFRPGEDELLLQVSAMKENARAAWEYAVQAERWDLLDSMMPALNRYHATREQQALFAGMIEDALRQTPPEAPIWASLIQMLVYHLRQVGRADDALRVAEAALPHLRRHASPDREVELMHQIGTMRLHKGELEAGRVIFEEALDRPGVSASPRIHARLLGQLALLSDDLDHHAHLVEEAIATARQDDSPVTLGVMLRLASSSATTLGRFEEAAERAAAALEVTTGLDDAGRIRPWVEVAFTRLNLGDLDAADEAVEQARRTAAGVAPGRREEAELSVALLDTLSALARGIPPDNVDRLERGRGELAPFLWRAAGRAYLEARRHDDVRRAIAHLRATMGHDPFLLRRAAFAAYADLFEAALLVHEGASTRAVALVHGVLERAVDHGLAPVAADALLVAARSVDAAEAQPWPELVARNAAASYLTRMRARREWKLSDVATGATARTRGDVEDDRRTVLDTGARAAELLAVGGRR